MCFALFGEGPEGGVTGGTCCSQVGRVVPFTTPADWCDVIDGGGLAGASREVDLAGVVVAFEYLSAYALPWSAVHRVCAAVLTGSHGASGRGLQLHRVTVPFHSVHPMP